MDNETSYGTRDYIQGIQALWEAMLCTGKFSMKSVYSQMRSNEPVVSWKSLICKNPARPRAVITLWLACHHKLATKERLVRFGFITDSKCCFCSSIEDINHILFECSGLRQFWIDVLNWINVSHTPKNWNEELPWII